MVTLYIYLFSRKPSEDLSENDALEIFCTFKIDLPVCNREENRFQTILDSRMVEKIAEKIKSVQERPKILLKYKTVYNSLWLIK